MQIDPGRLAVMIAVLALIGGAYWLIEDSRKKGAKAGGKLCGGCPHYCRMGRNCDGTPKEQAGATENAKEGPELPDENG